jgi:hypothetical protein
MGSSKERTPKLGAATHEPQYDILFDDDDASEAAEIVAIEGLIVHLFHCQNLDEERAGARRSLQRSVALGEPLLPQPETIMARREVAFASELLGGLALEDAEPETARVALDKALSVRSSLLRETQHCFWAQVDLGNIYQELGLRSLRSGRIEEAEAHLYNSVSLLEKCSQDDPNWIRVRRLLSTAHRRP